MKIQNQSMISFSIHRYQRNVTSLTKTLDKLSSGLRIYRASDDAAGLSISETLRAQIRGLAQSQRNMQDGLSVLKAAEEGLMNVNNLLQRIRELAVQNANDTLNASDRAASQKELEQLLQAIDDTAEKLEFNTQKILGENRPLILQVGANPGQTIAVDMVDTSTTSLGLNGATLLTRTDAEQLIAKVDNALKKVTNDLTNVGSDYEAIEHHLNNAMLKEGNLTASESLLRDTNIAREMMNYISENIRQQGDYLLISHVNRNVKDILELFA
ncbi:flagellin N-terminal helical domain-containing protein [Thermaerobacillus caldiproteolyticus]|uniref:flagellin N-terminal helical domain-containing protein n=1 Tax=Thermaerobacillus caldiproteolyticus TaxID=247480 RepID=UPI00188BF23B|nr:flagellin [Anoxybacillus caldiproteolyticus]QPA30686.1 flagellin [Anoxybacillus caldiproteolyticus]